MIALIDYDAGNLRSVEKAFAYIGEKAVVTRDRNTILKADKVVLPGVGAFGDAMGNLRKYELDKVIHEVANQHIPFIGICLGLHLLFDGSEESGGVEGLGILSGDIKKIPKKDELKIPHMGWNSLRLQNSGRLFQGIEQDSYVYFVHSYYLQARTEQIVKAVTDYSVCIHASVEKDNIFACQFHPEKSSKVGMQILRNFAAVTKEEQLC